VVLAHNLTPSDTAQMNRVNVLGFGTEVGGRTSHTAIIARSLAIPRLSACTPCWIRLKMAPR
jgi:phosphotransferase system enzyme I (PtsI)